MKTYVREMRQCHEQLVELGTDESSEIVSESVDEKVLKVASSVCEKRTRDLNALIDDPEGFEQLVSEEEWFILGANELNHDDL